MLYRSQRWSIEMRIFGPIFEAMGQIAKGDFNVQLDNQNADNPLVNQLATSVNNMALELNQLEAMRQEFISDVSHEIQSPLTSIRGFARALQNDELASAERNHYLTIIETESVRLSKLADNLLKLASLESKQVKFEPRAYRLDRQIRNLILTCEPQWMDKAIQMEVVLDEATITADEELLSQVWLNLLHNSIKFTPLGGKIWVELRPRDGNLEFKITDTGIGMTNERLASLSQPFALGDATFTREGIGPGLGISISRAIAELSGGHMAIDSSPSLGTTVAISLPIKLDSALVAAE
jgi:signal transduction histidine kinase